MTRAQPQGLWASARAPASKPRILDAWVSAEAAGTAELIGGKGERSALSVRQQRSQWWCQECSRGMTEPKATCRERACEVGSGGREYTPVENWL